MAAPSQTTGFPWGFLVVSIFAVPFYLVMAASLADSRFSDAAGRGMAAGFAGIAGSVLWILLGVLMLIAVIKGRLEGWAIAVAIVLGPLSAIAAFSGGGFYHERGGLWFAIPALLPPLWLLFALWVRMPGWHATLTPLPMLLVLGGAIVGLTIVGVGAGLTVMFPNPAAEARRAEEAKARQAEQERAVLEAEKADAEKFAKLGPNSSLRDYLDYLAPGEPRFRDAVAGARQVVTRNQDAAALLAEGGIYDLQELWQVGVDPKAVCAAYGAALLAEAPKVVNGRPRSVGLAIDLERQMTNIGWLADAGCDLSAAIDALVASLRTSPNEARLEKFAKTLEAYRKK
jgi:hypothetical protein